MNFVHQLSILTLFNLFYFSVAYQSKDHTLIVSPILRIASRRRRFLLLPNYGSIKVTAGLGKGLIGDNPKGLSLSYEICSYFAGPTVIKDWFNEITQKKPKQQEMIKSHKIGKLIDSIQQSYPNLLDIDYSNSSKSFYNNRPLKADIFDPSKLFSSNRKPKNIHRLFERSSSKTEYIAQKMINPRRKNLLRMSLDYLLGSDARCFILKSICRSKELLLPPGYSMIQDIVRIIVFGMTNDLKSDEESFYENKLHLDCDKEKKLEHSFNLIDWLINPKTIIV